VWLVFAPTKGRQFKEVQMAGRFLGARGSTRRHRSVAFAVFAALIAIAAVAVPSLANLSPSTFEGNDGNLVVDTTGNKDWVSTTINRVRGDDLASGKTDNSFGQGTKEDDPNVSVVTGSIPPQKSDLTRFYVGNETVSSKNFLYLAWERSNVLGSANMDFEINKLTQPNLTTTGAKTLNRSPGDLLITFDFTNGGGNPVLGALKWLTGGETTPATKDDCFSANALPCWGAQGDDSSGDDGLDGVDDERIDLSQAGYAEGAVNGVTVTDPIPTPSVTLPALTFGEASINLTDSGIIPPNSTSCVGFSSAFLKSRSSASFPAEVKDFVPPQPVNINTCGKIKVKKTDDAGNAIGGVTFKLKTDVAPLGPPDGPNGPNQDQPGAEDTLVSGKSCTTASTTDPNATPPTVKGECTIEDVPPGNYWVFEDPTTVPPGYDPTAPAQYAVVTVGGTVNLTTPGFVNPRLHKVIVVVCHQGSDTLYASDVSVTVGQTTTTRKSIAAVPAALSAKNVTEADLCAAQTGDPAANALGLESSTSAAFGGLGHGTVAPSVAIASH
jgi:hypothetical protein